MKQSRQAFLSWLKSEAAKTLLLRVSIAVGVVSLFYYYSWWARSGRITSPFLLIGLTLAVFYCGFQIVGTWVLYLAARRYGTPAPLQSGLTVDVFVTAYHEPYDLIRRALTAAVHMRGEHQTWLLDDGSDPLLKELAASLGVGYLTRSTHENAKAGNINAALARTEADIIVIFDADHAPLPDFLESTLGYFEDPRMGFVQVMLTFLNGKQSWVARAAAESSLDFYNPISLGMDRLGSATMMGSNALIRRKALLSIRGYQPGLAEDLATSIALHAAGWKSAYVAQPLAPGIAPPDVEAWATQQLKWARGVFQVLLQQFPVVFGSLNWRQRLAYGVRMTYYWIGPVVALHLGVTFYVLMSRNESAQRNLTEYLFSLLPLALLVLLIRQMALRRWRHPAIVVSLLWRAVVLIYATWPIYTLAWLMAVARIPLHFRLTPKHASGNVAPRWLLPQVLAVTALTVALPVAYLTPQFHPSPFMVVFTVAQILPQTLFLLQCVRSARAEKWNHSQALHSATAAEFKPVSQSIFRPNEVEVK